MNAQEIYKLANELTEQQVINVVNGWESINEIESIEMYKSLITLGDSMQLACATVIINKDTKKEVSDMYKNAYEK